MSPLEGTINPTRESVPNFARQDTPDLRPGPPENLLGDNLPTSEPPSPPPLDSILGQYQSPRKPEGVALSRFTPKTPEDTQKTPPKLLSRTHEEISIESHMSFGDLIDPPTPQTGLKRKKDRLDELLDPNRDSEKSKSSGYCSDRLDYWCSPQNISIRKYQSVPPTLTQDFLTQRDLKPWKHKSSEPFIDIDLDDLIKLKDKMASENANTQKADGSGFELDKEVGFDFDSMMEGPEGEPDG